MNLALLPVLACLPLTVGLAAQTAKDPSSELAVREAAAKDDVSALIKTADWAKEHGLLTEWRRLLQRVLALAPEHEAANQAVGNVKHEGRWMSPAKAEILQNRNAGLVSVGGVWVPEAEADDARVGVFHFAGERINRAEYLQLKGGKVRHPRTGELIDRADLEKAKNNLFPDGQGGWIDEAAANKRHASAASPWVVRTKTTTVVSTMPLKDIEQHAQQYVDDAHDFAASVLGPAAQSTRRPIVMLVPTADQFRDVGNQIGGASSAYGAFLATGSIDVPGLGPIQPAVALLDPNWGVYYTKHAVGLAVANGIAGSALPAWLTTAIGGYTERFYSGEIANWFGKQFLGAGGLLDLKTWFSAFAITGNMEPEEIGQQIFQAGLVVAFCRHGGDAEAGKLLSAIGEALAAGDPKAVQAAVDALEQGIQARVDALRAYLKTLTQG